MNVGIVICARVKSSRIQDKVLQNIDGRMAVEILLDNVINDSYQVVLAIPANKDDDILEKIAIKKGVNVYRGFDDSPLHRLYNAAIDYDFDYVVRITADDILINMDILKNQIRFALRQKWDYVFVKKCIEGMAGEVIKTDALAKVVENVNGEPVEFISYYLKKDGEFSVIEYYPPREYQVPFRCVMDYPEDLMLLRILFSSIPNPVNTLDIIHFLKRNKFYLNINKLPEVTIYTCNYNTGKYIVDCMSSVVNQDFDNYEFIVVDDNSSDDSMNIITEYYTSLKPDIQKKIKILRNHKNIGLPSNCNNILSMARGKYIVRVDSDDYIRNDFITKCIDRIKIDDVQAVFTGYIEIDGTDTKEVKENMYHPGCCLMSTWAANELKYKDDLKYMEGHEYFDRFNKKYLHSFIDECLWVYRQHPDQKTKQKDHPLNI